MNYENQRKEPALAGIFSFLIAGTGQMYCGEIGRGFGFLIGAIVGYILFVIPGLILSIWSAYDAYKLAEETNKKLDKILRKNKEEEENKISSSDFVKSVKKLYLLRENEILSQQEYLNKKNALISDLYTKQINEGPEDFLSSIISLKEEEILDKDEIQKIKLILY